MRKLLDTCVLSELVKPRPNENVVRWVEQQDEHRLYLSVITVGELYKGIAKLQEGPRRARLELWVAQDLTSRFASRILGVDAHVAAVWGSMLGQAETQGTPLPVIDALIAATAKAHSCRVITRNIADFEPTGVQTFSPW